MTRPDPIERGDVVRCDLQRSRMFGAEGFVVDIDDDGKGAPFLMCRWIGRGWSWLRSADVTLLQRRRDVDLGALF